MNYKLAERFKRFSKEECGGSSKLYEILSLQIAEDPELLKLASFTKEGQPVPNLFLGAVHYLLLEGYEHELTNYYPSIVQTAKSPRNAFPYFKNFVQMYKDEIIEILQTRLVQTNEVRRCGYLFSVFSYIHQLLEKPLALIEIGTSAGLQLLWDQYQYTYSSIEGEFGLAGSTVHIQSEVLGSKAPVLANSLPVVTNRIGVDLNIIDLVNQQDGQWLNALIWPEQKDRRQLFQKAADSIVKNNGDLNLIEGDGITLLPKLVEQVQPNSVLCIFHTHVANQMSNENKLKLLNQIREIGSSRDVFHIYNNMWDQLLHVDSYLQGIEKSELIFETDGHGRWFKWK